MEENSTELVSSKRSVKTKARKALAAILAIVMCFGTIGSAAPEKVYADTVTTKHTDFVTDNDNVTVGLDTTFSDTTITGAAFTFYLNVDEPVAGITPGELGESFTKIGKSADSLSTINTVTISGAWYKTNTTTKADSFTPGTSYESNAKVVITLEFETAEVTPWDVMVFPDVSKTDTQTNLMSNYVQLSTGKAVSGLTWDSTNRTLTMNGYNGSAIAFFAGDALFSNTSEWNDDAVTITIIVEGENYIKSAKCRQWGIMCSGNCKLLFKGSGSLVIELPGGTMNITLAEHTYVTDYTKYIFKTLDNENVSILLSGTEININASEGVDLSLCEPNSSTGTDVQIEKDGSTKVYGSWSKAKSVKIKK